MSLSPLTSGSTGFDTFAGDVAASADRLEARPGWIRQGAGPRFDSIELSVMSHHLTVTANSDEQLANAQREPPPGYLPTSVSLPRNPPLQIAAAACDRPKLPMDDEDECPLMRHTRG